MAGEVPLAEQAGHLKYFVQVLAQSQTLRLGGGVPQKLFPAGRVSAQQCSGVSDILRALTAPAAMNSVFCSTPDRLSGRAWVPQRVPEESCSFCCCKPKQIGPDRGRPDLSQRTVADQIWIIWVIWVPKVRHLSAQHVVGHVQPLQLRKHWLDASGKLVSGPAAGCRAQDQLSHGHHAVLRETASAAGPVWDDVHTV